MHALLLAGAASAATRRAAHDVRPLGGQKALAVFDISSAKWPALAADRVAWRATLKSGQPPDEYSARPPTPAAQPLACTRARRSTTTETNAAIDRSVRALRTITNIS